MPDYIHFFTKMAQKLHYCLSCLLLKETLKYVNTKLDISRMLSSRILQGYLKILEYIAGKKLKAYIFATTTFLWLLSW